MVKFIEEGILEAKTECYAKVFVIILQQFLVIFSTPTSVSFTKLKIKLSFWGAEHWTGLNHNWFKSYDTKCNTGQKE